jgi:hypothetical protein
MKGSPEVEEWESLREERPKSIVRNRCATRNKNPATGRRRVFCYSKVEARASLGGETSRRGRWALGASRCPCGRLG